MVYQPLVTGKQKCKLLHNGMSSQISEGTYDPLRILDLGGRQGYLSGLGGCWLYRRPSGMWAPGPPQHVLMGPHTLIPAPPSAQPPQCSRVCGKPHGGSPGWASPPPYHHHILLSFLLPPGTSVLSGVRPAEKIHNQLFVPKPFCQAALVAAVG